MPRGRTTKVVKKKRGEASMTVKSAEQAVAGERAKRSSHAFFECRSRAR
jgi:hypothetical protein